MWVMSRLTGQTNGLTFKIRIEATPLRACWWGWFFRTHDDILTAGLLLKRLSAKVGEVHCGNSRSV